MQDITYESILQRMLERVPAGIDKREGSIIYDALAPAAAELQIMYIELDQILLETFADTASREYLIRRAAERGIKPELATKAILKAEASPTSVDVPVGSRFSLNDLNYVVTEKITDGQYKVQCETSGSAGNSYLGMMIPIDYIQDLEVINLTEVLIPGEDDESTESIRQRYFDSFNMKAYGGNINDYLMETNALPGVGATKVEPVWNGGGTVKLTILNSEFSKASPTLVNQVQTAIDPTKDATGVGIAPIGHIVTVQTATEIAVNVNSTITFKSGYSFEQLKTKIDAAIKAYLLELRKIWANEDSSVVRISQVEKTILDIEGVLDITGTTINSVAGNLTLNKYEIPVFGGVVNG